MTAGGGSCRALALSIWPRSARHSLRNSATFSGGTFRGNVPTILVAILPMLDRGVQAPAGRFLRDSGFEPIHPSVPALPAWPRLRRRMRWASLVVRREVLERVSAR